MCARVCDLRVGCDKLLHTVHLKLNFLEEVGEKEIKNLVPGARTRAKGIRGTCGSGLFSS